jgi:hypothetical protein
MASITAEIKRSRKDEVKLNQAEQASSTYPKTMEDKLNPDKPNLGKPNPDEPIPGTSHRVVTQRERDSGTKSVSHTGQAELTGKLCWCMMVLIWWKVGADVAVMEHVVRALEEWLRRRGISIYTDLL